MKPCDRLYVMDAVQGDILCGLAAIVLSLWGAQHFKILLGLKRNVCVIRLRLILRTNVLLVLKSVYSVSFSDGTVIQKTGRGIGEIE